MVIQLQNFGKLFPAQTSALNELSWDLLGDKGGVDEQRVWKGENEDNRKATFP